MKRLFASLLFLANGLSADEHALTNQVVLSIDVQSGVIFETVGVVTGEDAESVPSREMLPCGAVIELDQEAEPDMPFPSLPGLESETNRVAIALLESARDLVVDNFDQEDADGTPCTSEVVAPTWTWNGFLGQDETNGLTRIAKKSCFDWYLHFVSTNTQPYSVAQAELVRVAVSRCESLCYTNSWEDLMAIASNPSAPYRHRAGECAVRFAPLGETLMTFCSNVYTNGILCDSESRGNIIHAYATRLNDCTGRAATSAAQRLFSHTPINCLAAMSLDRLYVTKIPGYENSSNRLEIAESVLRSSDSWESQINYFTTITNQLHSATQPLPAVRGL